MPHICMRSDVADLHLSCAKKLKSRSSKLLCNNSHTSLMYNSIIPKYDIDMHGSTKCCLVTGILVEVSCDHVEVIM